MTTQFKKFLRQEFWDSCAVEQLSGAPLNLSEVSLPEGAVIYQTSGSSGEQKWVVHTRKSLLSSAESVVKHLSVTASDIWFLALPVYHVGGFGVLARAYVSGCKVVHFSDKWDVCKAVGTIHRAEVTMCSLVPTQVVDIVRAGLVCPNSVRGVVVGGGRLDSSIKREAISLGWPVLESYGMTETASQIATQLDPNDHSIELISNWEVGLSDEGLLKVRGAGLFSGYLSKSNDGLVFSDPKSVEGWFTSSDFVDIDFTTNRLSFKSRNDRLVKILGELVSLDLLEQQLTERCGFVVMIVDVPDERRGVKLVPVIELQHQNDLNQHHFELSGLHQLGSAVFIENFPRNPMGKLDRRRLRESVVFSAD